MEARLRANIQALKKPLSTERLTRRESLDQTDLKNHIIKPEYEVTSEIPSKCITECPELRLANWHLENYPFAPRQEFENQILWYEGSFDPPGPHHLDVWKSAWKLGFKSGVFAVCHQNPLKKDSTPFETRVELCKLWFREMGFEIANKLGEPGIYIESDPDLFQYQKIVNFYSGKTQLLMGPDNFERYYAENVPWSHVPDIRNNKRGVQDFGFKRMYTEVPGFADSILVYPRLHKIHSTDIRNNNTGELSKMIPSSVKELILDRELYSNTTSKIKTPDTKQKPKRLQTPAVSFVLAREIETKLENILNSSLNPNLVPTVTLQLKRSVDSFDISELLEIKTALDKHETVPQQSKFSPHTEPLTQISDTIVESLLNSHAQIDGAETLIESLLSKKTIIFVANNRGEYDKAFIPYALRNSGLSNIANKLVFANNSDPSGSELEKTISNLMTSSIRLEHEAQPLSEQELKDSQNKKKSIRDKNSELVAKRLNKGFHCVLFPEQNNNTQMGVVSNQVSQLLSKEHFKHLKIDINDIVVIPMASFGAEPAHENKMDRTVWATEDTPYTIRLGAPVSLKDLQDVMSSEVIRAEANDHILGHMISELLPENMKGAYGANPEDLGTPKSVSKDINQAAKLLSGLSKFRKHF